MLTNYGTLCLDRSTPEHPRVWEDNIAIVEEAGVVIDILAGTRTGMHSSRLSNRLADQFQVVLTAYCQYVEAKDLGRYMRSLLKQKEPPSMLKRVTCATTKFFSLVRMRSADKPNGDDEDLSFGAQPWTITRSLYATMGGFVVSSSDRTPLPGQSHARMVLTVPAIKLIAKYEPEIFTTLSESAIQDKSKANTFVKFLTCSQATWFCIQCLTRYMQDLSVSLLEINTAAHAICALALYFFFWWNKPLDVDEGSPLPSEASSQVGAYLTACTKLGHRFGFGPIRDGTFATASSDSLHRDWPVHASELVRDASQHSSLDIMDSSGRGSMPDNSLYRDSTDSFETGSLSEHFSYDDTRIHEFCVERYRNTDPPATDEEVALLKLASGFARKHGISGDLRKCLEEVCSEDPNEKLLTTRIQNRPKDHLIFGPQPTPLYGTPTPRLGFWERLNRGVLMRGLIMTSFFYGGFHLLAWNHHFRTATEELLWKISALTITTFGVAYFLAIYLFGRFDEGDFARQDYVYCFCAVTPNILGILFYVFCRVYIIIECLLDVFHLPESAFRVPQWSQYFPHLS